MFCEKCDAVLIPKKQSKKRDEAPTIGCPDCDFTLEEDEIKEIFVITEKIEHDIDAFIEVVDEPTIENKITPDIREELREQFREAAAESD